MSLPSSHTGGELLIEHNDKTVSYQASADEVSVAAFYADVLRDGGVDLGFLDLLGGCAVSQGLQRVVLVHRNHYSGFAAEADDVVTVVL